jgi:hypothetical protein
VYVVFLSVVMANISCNLVMLQEHLEQLQDEVGERWHMGVYAMLIMFKQFRRAVTLMVVAKLMVCYFPIHFTMIKKIQSRQFSSYLGP